MISKISPQLTNRKQGNPLTPAQIKRRAQWNQLVLSLSVPQRTSINTETRLDKDKTHALQRDSI